MTVKFNVRGSLNRKLDKQRIKYALEQATERTMRELKDECVKKAPKVTGNLRRSHSYERRSGNDMVEGLIKNSANYWQYVNFGTSRMKKNPGQNYMSRAVQKVNPPEKIAKYFKEKYKGA